MVLYIFLFIIIDESLLIDDKAVFILKQNFCFLLLLKVLILLNFCTATSRLLFTYLLPMHNSNLCFLHCSISYLTAHQTKLKAWGKAKRYCGSLEVSEKQLSWFEPNMKLSTMHCSLNSPLVKKPVMIKR